MALKRQDFFKMYREEDLLEVFKKDEIVMERMNMKVIKKFEDIENKNSFYSYVEFVRDTRNGLYYLTSSHDKKIYMEDGREQDITRKMSNRIEEEVFEKDLSKIAIPIVDSNGNACALIAATPFEIKITNKSVKQLEKIAKWTVEDDDVLGFNTKLIEIYYSKEEKRLYQYSREENIGIERFLKMKEEEYKDLYHLKGRYEKIDNKYFTFVHFDYEKEKEMPIITSSSMLKIELPFSNYYVYERKTLSEVMEANNRFEEIKNRKDIKKEIKSEKNILTVYSEKMYTSKKNIMKRGQIIKEIDQNGNVVSVGEFLTYEKAPSGTIKVKLVKYNQKNSIFREATDNLECIKPTKIKPLEDEKYRYGIKYIDSLGYLHGKAIGETEGWVIFETIGEECLTKFAINKEKYKKESALFLSEEQNKEYLAFESTKKEEVQIIEELLEREKLKLPKKMIEIAIEDKGVEKFFEEIMKKLIQLKVTRRLFSSKVEKEWTEYLIEYYEEN